ncbi:hypothetical protein GGS26DRAFT_546505 [Hypomontagnella submonticulosa]|nr:hypothetical protein GGS26DRAFT_546505 [Hypomontagnella submonticulosa]
MSTSQDEELNQELIDRIRGLAGKINRHKAQRDGVNSDLNYASRSSAYRAAPYPRGVHRGGRGRGAPFRNRTLVLNGQSRSTTDTTEKADEPSDPATPSWVTRTDRHMQLINSSVFERETQQRANAMNQTHRQRQAQRSNLEKIAFMNTVAQNAARGNASGFPNTPTSAPAYELVVDGIRFYVVQKGSKLVKAPGDVNPPSATPKTTSIGGVKFHRTKHGNLVRHSIVQAQRFVGGVKKVNEQCKTFSWTGSCPKGPGCRYIHDVSKTAVCRDYLLKGKCLQGDACDLSHDITEQRTPLCVHFAKGNCHNASCSYVHAEHSPTDPVCPAFGFYGYCEKGAQCPDRHVFECPNFSNTGVCNLKGCKRPHIERASVLRKANHRMSSEEMEDLSSDDDAAADSDDVDSDEVEEFVMKDDDDDLDFAEQKDYIKF